MRMPLLSPELQSTVVGYSVLALSPRWLPMHSTYHWVVPCQFFHFFVLANLYKSISNLNLWLAFFFSSTEVYFHLREHSIIHMATTETPFCPSLSVRYNCNSPLRDQVFLNLLLFLALPPYNHAAHSRCIPSSKTKTYMLFKFTQWHDIQVLIRDLITIPRRLHSYQFLALSPALKCFISSQGWSFSLPNLSPFLYTSSIYHYTDLKNPSILHYNGTTTTFVPHQDRSSAHTPKWALPLLPLETPPTFLFFVALFGIFGPPEGRKQAYPFLLKFFPPLDSASRHMVIALNFFLFSYPRGEVHLFCLFLTS